MSVARFVFSVPALPSEDTPRNPVIPAILRKAIGFRSKRDHHLTPNDEEELYRQDTPSTAPGHASPNRTTLADNDGNLTPAKQTSVTPDSNHSNRPNHSNTLKLTKNSPKAAVPRALSPSSSATVKEVTSPSTMPTPMSNTPKVLDEDAILAKLEELRAQKRRIFENIAAQPVRPVQSKSNTSSCNKRSRSDSSGGATAAGGGNNISSSSNSNIIPMHTHRQMGAANSGG
ncbi:hypothetical protein SeMB42_g00269 [Synchytrium endobioticum]|uniref:Uncharacterized protein n=1 Tax=Synchytrium endobioticum TaxID=286115 RepID=A0A507DU39_9FUNG|nr:hypothetical protein SeLEV6574_g00393 [Synchytrium endobioticum]TPX54458.1 hypothetical protein SeMB42_g00269 [Synchytrium endobioticum]